MSPIIAPNPRALESSRSLPSFEVSLPDDAIVRSKTCSVPGFDHARLNRYANTIQSVRRLLRDGCADHRVKPFVFRADPSDPLKDIVAKNSGLEGFLFSRRRFERQYGEWASARHFDDYVNYLGVLLDKELYGKRLLEQVRDISEASLPIKEKHRTLVDALERETAALREIISREDQSLAGRNVRMRTVFIRAEDIQTFRELHGIEVSDPVTGRFFEDRRSEDYQGGLRQSGYNAERYIGLNPIGELHAKGTGGGSPYSARSHRVSEGVGGSAGFARAAELAYNHGVMLFAEVVPNHTSCDSDLLKMNPSLFIHRRDRPDDSSGYMKYEHPVFGEFYIRKGGYKDLATGKRESWSDVLQLDLSNPVTREYLISEVCDLIESNGLDGIRIDSAYQLLSEYFAKNWEGETQFELPDREFLADLISRVKMKFPHVVVVAEAFTSFDSLAECGVDLVYGLTNMERKGGYEYIGWNQGLRTVRRPRLDEGDSREVVGVIPDIGTDFSPSPESVRAAIEDAEFFLWQMGGPGALAFWNHQDFPSFELLYGERWKWGAAVLTLLRPSISVYAGPEVGFQAPCQEDRKVITFNEPVRITNERANEDFSVFQRNLLAYSALVRDALGECPRFEALWPAESNSSGDWAGYLLSSTLPGNNSKLAVVVNTAAESVTAHFVDRETNQEYSVDLDPIGPTGFAIVPLVDASRLDAPYSSEFEHASPQD